MDRKGWDTLSPSTTSPALCHTIRKEIQTSRFSLRNRIFSSQLLRLPLKRQGPKHLALKAKGACVHQTHKTTANKESVLKGHMSPCQVSLMSSVHWEEAKTPLSQSFPRKGSESRFYKLLPKGPTSNLAGIEGLAAILLGA